MKKSILLLLPLLTLSLSSCTFNPFAPVNPPTPEGEGGETDPADPSDPSDPTDPTDPEDPADPGEDDPIDPEDPLPNPRMQDRAILHCWNWSMNTIKNHLEEIKASGYKAIQISPMQPQKDYPSGGYGSWRNEWWKLYQPLGFEIARSNQNLLGNKDELESMCAKASEYDIDVIVDIVSNHLAGGSENSLNPNVRNFEQEIYDNELIHKLGRGVNDNDVEAQVRGHLGGYPDLKTEDERVQKRVLHLLKEYLDVGVDGFRFDAAKHIETENDGDYASNFWNYVLGGATEYAVSKGLNKPYYYGEILGTPGKNRPFSYYTDKMSVVDSTQGSNTLKGVTRPSTAYISSKYSSGLTSDKVVLWAESHDTYANDGRETTDIENKQIIKAYAMQASRKGAASLFFARPYDETAYMGAYGDPSFKSNIVTAVNTFHNAFISKKENVEISSEYFVNVRSDYGAVIVNVDGSSTFKDTMTGLKDGTYVDMVNNKTYQVSGSKANITLTNDVAVLIEQSKLPKGDPTISFDTYNQVYSNTQNIKVNIANATKVTCSINGTSYTINNGIIALPTSLPNGRVEVKVVAENESGRVEQAILLIKTDNLVNAKLIITDVPSETYLLWVWSTGSDGRFISLTKDGDMLGTNESSFKNFILVEFPSGTTASTADWSSKVAQGSDMTFNKLIYSFDELGVK